MRVVVSGGLSARIWWFVAALALLAAGGPAAAQNKNVDVKSGQRTGVGHIAAYAAANCGSLLMKRPATGKAANGKVYTDWVKHTFKEGICKGKTIDVIVVSYQSNRGYRGKDTVIVSYWGPRARFAQSETPALLSRRFQVTVK